MKNKTQLSMFIVYKQFADDMFRPKWAIVI
jgi:hypothetical protein